MNTVYRLPVCDAIPLPGLYNILIHRYLCSARGGVNASLSNNCINGRRAAFSFPRYHLFKNMFSERGFVCVLKNLIFNLFGLQIRMDEKQACLCTRFVACFIIFSLRKRTPSHLDNSNKFDCSRFVVVS